MENQATVTSIKGTPIVLNTSAEAMKALCLSHNLSILCPKMRAKVKHKKIDGPEIIIIAEGIAPCDSASVCKETCTLRNGQAGLWVSIEEYDGIACLEPDLITIELIN